MLPDFFADFSFDHVLDEEFADQRLPAGGIPAVGGGPDDDEWVFSVAAELPLFEGGDKKHELDRAKADLEQFVQTRERVRQLIEQDTLTAFYAIEGSHPSIAYSRTAADRAHKNLEIVGDQYARGAANIIDLLDAQNEAFTADQAAAISVYRYLQDLVDYQRAISWFELFGSKEEKAAWVARLEAYLDAGGEP